MTRVVLVHGAATSARVWERLTPLLPGWDVTAVTRPRTGDLDREVAWLADRAVGAWVVGMSGGATLGLALASTGTHLLGAVLHEPAAGSLAPGLLAPMVAAFEQGGTEAFAQTLYGGSWSPALAEGARDDEVTARELAMFRGFEPGPPSASSGRVVVTCGSRSPQPRHDAAAALRARHGYEVASVPAAGHFAAYDAPEAFAAVVRSVVED